jgi:hypothetical protein
MARATQLRAFGAFSGLSRTAIFDCGTPTIELQQ